MQKKWILLTAVVLGFGSSLPLPVQANEAISQQTKKTTLTSEELYTLYYVPPLYSDVGSITPELQLKKSGASVTGSSVYREGWCGNESPQTEKVLGKWTDKSVKLTISSSSGKETLEGTLDIPTEIIIGKSSNKRLFALIKNTRLADDSISKRKISYPGFPESSQALSLEKEARRQSVNDPKLAETTWLKALAIWDKLPPTNLERIEARIRFAKFYCTSKSKYDLADIGKSADACRMFSEVSRMVAAQEQSKEASTDPERWIDILKELTWFYENTKNTEKSEQTFWQMISWMKRIPDNAVQVARALDRRANQLSQKNPKESERLKLQALALWKTQSDKNREVAAYYDIIDWYRKKNQFVDAENKTRELAKSVGLNPSEVQLGPDFRKLKSSN